MNSDHRENIGTHPCYSDDPETALRARLDAATRRKQDADATYQKARDNLRVFLAHKDAGTVEAVPTEGNTSLHPDQGLVHGHVDDEQEAKP